MHFITNQKTLQSAPAPPPEPDFCPLGKKMLAIRREMCIIDEQGVLPCSYGLVAQLGERSVRIREVEGSNPFGSTISRKITANSAVILPIGRGFGFIVLSAVPA